MYDFFGFRHKGFYRGVFANLIFLIEIVNLRGKNLDFFLSLIIFIKKYFILTKSLIYFFP